MYEAARKVRRLVARAFLFTTARHLVADRIGRASVVSFCSTTEAKHLDTLADEISPEQQLLARIELAELDRAFNQLSAKCRRVVWMRRVQSLSQREIALRLGVSEKTLEKHVRVGESAAGGAGAPHGGGDPGVAPV